MDTTVDIYAYLICLVLFDLMATLSWLMPEGSTRPWLHDGCSRGKEDGSARCRNKRRRRQGKNKKNESKRKGEETRTGKNCKHKTRTKARKTETSNMCEDICLSMSRCLRLYTQVLLPGAPQDFAVLVTDFSRSRCSHASISCMTFW